MKIPFKQNVGMMDRFFRICMGTVLAVLGVLLVKGSVGTILVILSIPLLVSGSIGFALHTSFLEFLRNEKEVVADLSCHRIANTGASTYDDEFLAF